MTTFKSFYKVNIATPPGIWDMTNAAYDNKLYDTVAETTGSRGVAFNPDGTIMYVTSGDGVDNDIYQYTLSTAWDVSTASYASKTYNILEVGGTTSDVMFNPDGTIMYVILFASGIFQYTLSTAWDVSTAAYASKTFFDGTTNGFNALDISPDGTRLFIGFSADSRVRSYTLSPAWDISTAVYDNKELLMPGRIVRGIRFKYDGTRLFVNWQDTEETRQFDLSTAWDITTAVDNGVFADLSFTVDPRGLVIGDNGNKFWVTDGNAENVYQYTM